MYSPSMFNTATAHNIFCSIGFNSDRIKVVEIKWRDDEVGSKGGRNFNLLSNGGLQYSHECSYYATAHPLVKDSCRMMARVIRVFYTENVEDS